MRLLVKFESSFAEKNDDFGRTSLVYHGIDTQGATPIRQQPRRLPYHRRDEVRKLLDSMLSWGLVAVRGRHLLLLLKNGMGQQDFVLISANLMM